MDANAIKQQAYMLFVAAAAAFIGWASFSYFRPIIIEASCSEIASNSSTTNSAKVALDPYYKYENVKARCLEEVISPAKLK